MKLNKKKNLSIKQWQPVLISTIINDKEKKTKLIDKKQNQTNTKRESILMSNETQLIIIKKITLNN